MKTNTSKIFAGVLAAAVCLGCAARARAFWTDGGQGGGALEQLGLSADVKNEEPALPMPEPMDARESATDNDPELDAIQTDTDEEQPAAVTPASPENHYERIKAWWQRHTQGAPYTRRHRPLLLKKEWEDKLGAILYRRFLSGAYLSRNQSQLAMLDRVGRRLAAISDRTDWQWEFVLMDMGPTDASGLTGDQNQAFALPGGKVGILAGMLNIAQDDSALAALLGHEMAHAIARHMGERITEMIIIQAGLSAGGALIPGQAVPLLMIPAAIHGGMLLEMAKSVYSVGSGPGSNLLLKGFKKVQEQEADYIGLVLMARAGYDPLKGVAFWKELLTGGRQTGQRAGHGTLDKLEKYFRLHPINPARVTKMEDCVEQVRAQYYLPQTTETR